MRFVLLLFLQTSEAAGSRMQPLVGKFFISEPSAKTAEFIRLSHWCCVRTGPLRSGQIRVPTPNLSWKFKPQLEHTRPAQKAAPALSWRPPTRLSSSNPSHANTTSPFKHWSLRASTLRRKLKAKFRAPSASLVWPVSWPEAVAVDSMCLSNTMPMGIPLWSLRRCHLCVSANPSLKNKSAPETEREQRGNVVIRMLIRMKGLFQHLLC